MVWYGAARPIMFEDWEGSFPGNWQSGGGTGTSAYSVQSTTVIEGSNTLESTGDFDSIGNTTLQCDRDGRAYGMKVRCESGTANGPGVLFNVQTASSPLDNCYWYRLDVTNDRMTVFNRTNGSSTTIHNVSVTGGIATSTVYEMQHVPDENGFTSKILDSTGSVLNSASSTNTDHPNGGFGLYNDSSSGIAMYWDALKKY